MLFDVDVSFLQGVVVVAMARQEGLSVTRVFFGNGLSFANICSIYGKLGIYVCTPFFIMAWLDALVGIMVMHRCFFFLVRLVWLSTFPVYL